MALRHFAATSPRSIVHPRWVRIVIEPLVGTDPETHHPPKSMRIRREVQLFQPIRTRPVCHKVARRLLKVSVEILEYGIDFLRPDIPTKTSISTCHDKIRSGWMVPVITLSTVLFAESEPRAVQTLDNHHPDP